MNETELPLRSSESCEGHREVDLITRCWVEGVGSGSLEPPGPRSTSLRKDEWESGGRRQEAEGVGRGFSEEGTGSEHAFQK